MNPDTPCLKKISMPSKPEAVTVPRFSKCSFSLPSLCPEGRGGGGGEEVARIFAAVSTG